MQLDAFHQSRVRISINLSNDILTSLILIAVDVNLVQQHKFLTHNLIEVGKSSIYCRQTWTLTW